MRLSAFYIFFTFCLFQVRSDLITEFSKTLSGAIKKIVDYEQDFADSVIVTLSNLKDLSTDVNSKALQATLDQAELTSEKAKTDETVCIATAKDKFGERIIELSFGLDTCAQEPRKIGDSIRKKFQAAHEKTLKMEQDLKEVTKSCSSDIEKLEKCISEKISETQKKLTNLLEDVRMNNIAGETIKSKILSESLKCSAIVSNDMLKLANEFQGLFKNCIK